VSTNVKENGLHVAIAHSNWNPATDGYQYFMASGETREQLEKNLKAKHQQVKSCNHQHKKINERVTQEIPWGSDNDDPYHVTHTDYVCVKCGLHSGYSQWDSYPIDYDRDMEY
jgi:predicted secreted Zn-dependent protease